MLLNWKAASQHFPYSAPNYEFAFFFDFFYCGLPPAPLCPFFFALVAFSLSFFFLSVVPPCSLPSPKLSTSFSLPTPSHRHLFWARAVVCNVVRVCNFFFPTFQQTNHSFINISFSSFFRLDGVITEKKTSHNRQCGKREKH